MLSASSRLLVQRRATLALPVLRGVSHHSRVVFQRDFVARTYLSRRRFSSKPVAEEEHGPIMRNAGKIAFTIIVSICTWLYRSSSENANREEVKNLKWHNRIVSPHEINDIRRSNRIVAQDLVRVSQAVHAQFPGSNSRATIKDFERVLRRELRSESPTGLKDGVRRTRLSNARTSPFFTASFVLFVAAHC
jgi:hypothetical protein